jgi:ABC-type phosphate/phosphonate transport system substrate-binding protein
VNHIAALPMYDFPELRDAHSALWAALRVSLVEAGVIETPRQLNFELDHLQVWKHPSLLFSQGCEYPLAKSFSDSIKLVATPRYTARGCEGAHYRSAIVVRQRSSAERLADLRHGVCAINDIASNSGMNLLRAAIAPLANGTRFFESVLFTGSHRRSVESVAAGEADVAAIDCVSLAHFERLYPSLMAQLRVLGWTRSTPSLPFITGSATSETTLQAVRSSLTRVLADRSLDRVRQRLFLDGVDLQPISGFGSVLRLEREAEELGYPVLH